MTNTNAVAPSVPAGLAVVEQRPAPSPNERRPERPAQAIRPNQRRAPYQLSTRKPRTGCSWPLLMVAGGEYSGKSYETALLAADERIGRTWWLPVNEDAEQYGEIADYEIVNHDGTIYEIRSAVRALKQEISREPLIDGKPQLVTIDSGSGIWALLSEIAENRALKTDEAREARLRNPNADITIGTLHWNAVNKIWRQIMTDLITMPAIVVMTSRAKMTVQIGPGGAPLANAPKVFTPELPKGAPYDSTAFIRLDRELAPTVIGVRKARGGIRPGRDEPLIFDGQPHGPDRPWRLTDFSLARIVFGLLEFDPAQARVREINGTDADADEQSPAETSSAPAPIEGADENPGKPNPPETMPSPDRRER